MLGGVLPVNDFIQRMIASRKELFWDKGPLDPETDKFVIVERVLEFETERESQEILSCYGAETVRDVVRNSRNLSLKTVNYFAMLLDIPREAYSPGGYKMFFRCITADMAAILKNPFLKELPRKHIWQAAPRWRSILAIASPLIYTFSPPVTWTACNSSRGCNHPLAGILHYPPLKLRRIPCL